MTDPEDRRTGSEPAPPPVAQPENRTAAVPDPPPAVGPTPEPPPPVEFEPPGGGSDAERAPDVRPTGADPAPVPTEPDAKAAVDVEPVDVVPADDALEPEDADDDDYDDAFDDDDDEDDVQAGDRFVPLGWVTTVTALGLGLVTVAGAQVLASIVEGLSLREGEPDGIPNDLLHRLGNPFDRRMVTVLLLLIVGVIVLALPAILDEDSTEAQDAWVNVALVSTTVLAVIIAIGSGLRVRYELHGFAEANQAVPRFFRIQLVSFLLGSLGAAAVAAWGSLAAMRLRDRWR